MKPATFGPPLMLLLFLLPLAHVPVLAQTVPRLSTADVTTRVEAEVRSVPGGEDVEVKVNEGHVVLSGTVRSAIHRDQLIERVEKLRGVTRVTPDLEIEPENRTDEEIERDAQAALAHDAETRSLDLEIDARDGVVTLRGEVDTGADRQAVQDVVESVRGVRDVQNHIELASMHREDHAIERDVEVELTASVVVEDPIQVLVEDGKVALSGTVDSLFERSWAIRRAWSVRGVQEVSATDLEVNPLQWNEDEPTPPLRSDAQVVQAIVSAFYREPVINAQRPVVKVDGEHVTLSGTVQTVAAKRRASLLAEVISGVDEVDNRMVVEPAEPVSDQEIERRVQEAFERSVVVEGTGIEVDVNEGQLTLTGSVDSTIEKDVAEELAAETRGAVALVSNITIRPDPEYSRRASAAE